MLRFIALAALLAFSSLAEDTQPGRAKRQATRGPTVTTGSESSAAGAGLAGSGPDAAASSPSAAGSGLFSASAAASPSAAGSGSASASAAASPSAAGSGAEGKGSDKGKGSAIGDEDAYIANEKKKMDNAVNAEIEVVNTLVDLLQEAGNVDVVISIDPVPVKANPLLYAKAANLSALEDGEWVASKGEVKGKGKGKGKGVVDEGSGSGASSAASSGAGSAASSGASSAASTGASSAASSAAGSGAQAASLLETDIKPAKKAAGRSGESSASGSGQGSGSANKADTQKALEDAGTVAAAGSGSGSGSGTGKVEAANKSAWMLGSPEERQVAYKGNHTGKGKDKGKGKDTEDASMIFGMDHSNLNATFEIHYNATDNETVAKMENIISRKKVNVAIKFQVPGPMMNLTGLVV